jgi:hypothetical protein
LKTCPQDKEWQAMTTAVTIAVVVLGIVLILLGIATYLFFRFLRYVFERSLKSELAAQGREQVEVAAERISHPLVRRFVTEHVVTTGGTIAVSLARSTLQSRMRMGLWLALGGLTALVAGVYVDSRLPLIWKPS